MDSETTNDNQQETTDYDTRDPEVPIVIHHGRTSVDHQYDNHKYAGHDPRGITLQWLKLACIYVWDNALWNKAFWLFAATITMAVATALYTHYAKRQLKAIGDQLPEIRKSADAAAKAADINAKQFEVTERPRLAGEMKLTKLIIDKNGLSLSFTLHLANSGPTPALKTVGEAEVFPLQITGPEPSAVRDRLCNHAEEQTMISRFAFTVYPAKEGEKQKEVAFTSPISRSDMETAAQRLAGHIVPAIAICVAYRPSFSSDVVYKTGFIYHLSYIPDPKSPKRTLVPVQDGTIPVEKLDVFDTNHSGGPEISPD